MFIPGRAKERRGSMRRCAGRRVQRLNKILRDFINVSTGDSRFIRSTEREVETHIVNPVNPLSFDVENFASVAADRGFRQYFEGETTTGVENVAAEPAESSKEDVLEGFQWLHPEGEGSCPR